MMELSTSAGFVNLGIVSIFALMITFQVDQVADIVFGLRAGDSGQIVANTGIQIAFAFADDVQLRFESVSTARRASVNGEEAVLRRVSLVQITAIG
jgi:hypothetical protein